MVIESAITEIGWCDELLRKEELFKYSNQEIFLWASEELEKAQKLEGIGMGEYNNHDKFSR